MMLKKKKELEHELLNLNNEIVLFNTKRKPTKFKK